MALCATTRHAGLCSVGADNNYHTSADGSPGSNTGYANTRA